MGDAHLSVQVMPKPILEIATSSGMFLRRALTPPRSPTRGVHGLSPPRTPPQRSQAASIERTPCHGSGKESPQFDVATQPQRAKDILECAQSRLGRTLYRSCLRTSGSIDVTRSILPRNDLSSSFIETEIAAAIERVVQATGGVTEQSSLKALVRKEFRQKCDGEVDGPDKAFLALRELGGLLTTANELSGSSPPSNTQLLLALENAEKMC